MEKIIKKIGNSVGVFFNKEEQKINNIHVGKIYDITIKEKTQGEEKHEK